MLVNTNPLLASPQQHKCATITTAASSEARTYIRTSRSSHLIRPTRARQPFSFLSDLPTCAPRPYYVSTSSKGPSELLQATLITPTALEAPQHALSIPPQQLAQSWHRPRHQQPGPMRQVRDWKLSCTWHRLPMARSVPHACTAHVWYCKPHSAPAWHATCPLPSMRPSCPPHAHELA